MAGKLKERDLLHLGDGMHGDGDYLWLRIKGVSRSWIVRGPRDANGKKPEAGLGSVARVSLALARKKRDELVEQWRNGKDPIAERRAARKLEANRRTFGEVARLKIEQMAPGWRPSFEGRAGTLEDWKRSLERVCKPIADMAIDELGIEDIKRIVAPYWDRGQHKTGRDLVKRIEAVFEFAFAHGWCPEANPAAWRLFRHIWPAKPPGKKHHAALPWRDAPTFIERLRASDAVTARVVEFAILTATRSGETRGAKWSEIDLEAKTWGIPAERMKKGVKHVVPLSDQAIALLERVKAEGAVGEYVFPAYADVGRTLRNDKPISNRPVYNLTKRLAGDEATTHGFRSTFRDWCGDHGIDRVLAEGALAHAIGDASEQAYARSQLVARRAPIMQAWADFVDGVSNANVIPLKRSA